MTERMTGRLSIAAAAQAIRARQTTPQALLEKCLAAIDRHEPAVHAWVAVDRTGAHRAADEAARELAAGRDRGPLHGIPLGIKDIVDVAGLPTRAGSPLTSPEPAAADATVVSRLREAGAVILGKTMTTEFACFDPSPTRNPWNLAHTPGGSSSGSAAAVSLGMCFAAIGSQTGGSITRPASYCGIAGCKPTFGRTSRAGVLPVSFHLDHVGTMAGTAADCGLLLAAIAGRDEHDAASSPRPRLGAMRAIAAAVAPPRLGIIWPYFFEQCDGEVAERTRAAVHSLAAGGATLVELPLPRGWDRVHELHRRIYFAEAADVHRRMFGAPRPGYSPTMAALLEEGFATSLADYQEALRQQVGFRHEMAALLAAVDSLVTPATPTAAPADLTTTGDPQFNSPWSYAGVPTVSIPCALTAAGMPLAMQVVGLPWSEEQLLSVAAWCEEVLAFDALPPMVKTA
ncbi:MAG: amidase [Pirellulales bacterium]